MYFNHFEIELLTFIILMNIQLFINNNFSCIHFNFIDSLLVND